MIANLKPEANYQLAITNFQFEMPHALPDSPHHRRHPRHSLRNRLPRPPRFDSHPPPGSPRIPRAQTRTDAPGLTMAQFFGAALRQLALVFLFTRDIPATHIPRLALGAFIGELAGLWVAIRIQLAGHVNTLAG